MKELIDFCIAKVRERIDFYIVNKDERTYRLLHCKGDHERTYGLLYCKDERTYRLLHCKVREHIHFCIVKMRELIDSCIVKAVRSYRLPRCKGERTY